VRLPTLDAVPGTGTPAPAPAEVRGWARRPGRDPLLPDQALL